MRTDERGELPPGTPLPVSRVSVTYLRYDEATDTQYVEMVNNTGYVADIRSGVTVNGSPVDFAGTWSSAQPGEAKQVWYNPRSYGYGTIAWTVYSAQVSAEQKQAASKDGPRQLEGLCTLTNIAQGVDNWKGGEDLYRCNSAGDAYNFVVDIPKQTREYRVKVEWGGYDKSNSKPLGSVNLYVNTDEYKTSISNPQPGDDDKTYRWDGSKSVVVPADQPRRFRVHHATSGSKAEMTYLRIQFLA